jgi:hypothetical protein
MHGFLGAAAGMFGVTSGEERQFDFTGAGTVLLQSSEKGVTDPHLIKELESQVSMLGVPGLTRMQSVVQARLAQERS